ncbi:MAG: hypothetical protein H7832_02325 [Magnetococcus sp. DMHC-6]
MQKKLKKHFIFQTFFFSIFTPVLASEPIPVQSVALFSSGVGYFQHGGKIAGGTEVQLPFLTTQINDVLKSLVLEDLDGGQPGFVIYPSQDPLDRILGGFQVDLTQDPTLPQILGQLRGTQVRAEYQGEQITGTLLGSELRALPVKDPDKQLSDWVINLSSKEGLRVLPLRDIRRLELLDPLLNAELEKALQALDRGRGKDKKPITIRFPGTGEHRVRIGYVVETPVWKTSYRLIIPEKEGKKSTYIQGWAIVENQSDNDWDTIQLSLVSGRPISFIQDLYQPQYANRPMVQLSTVPLVQPQTYASGLNETKVKTRSIALQQAAPMAMREQLPNESVVASGGQNDANMAFDAASPPPSDWEAAALNPSGIASAALADSVGQLFQFSVKDVSLPRRRSAMIPIVSDPIQAQKVSIYNASTLPNHPLNGVMLENTTNNNLPSGPVTLYVEGLYAGDARLDDLPMGEKRLLSYAVDLEVKISPPQETAAEAISSGKIVKGVLNLTRKLTSTRNYHFENIGKNDKSLIIEHPRHSDWQLARTTPPLETTDRWYRFRKELPAQGQTDLSITSERILEQSFALLQGDTSSLLSFSTTATLPDSVQAALEKTAQLKQKLESTQREKIQAEQQASSFVQEQTRIQANLRSVANNTNFHTRMLQKLNDLESEIEAKQTLIRQLEQRANEQNINLEKWLNDLVVE